MKNLVRAGYFELDFIAIAHTEQPNEPKVAIKTYKITDKGLTALMLSPVMENGTGCVAQ